MRGEEQGRLRGEGQRGKDAGGRAGKVEGVRTTG